MTAFSPSTLSQVVYSSSSDDPFLATTATRAPPPFFAPSTPSPSLAPNKFAPPRFNSANPLSIAIPSSPSVAAKRSSPVYGLPPSPAPFVGYAHSSGAFMWPTTTTTTPSTLSSSPRTFPSFPISPMSPLSPTFAPSLDVEMLDAYTTPPSTRILPATSTLRFSVDPPPKPVLTPYRIPVHPNAPKQFGPRGTLSPIKISLLATTEAPLTPPLTPPCPPFLSLPPIEIQAVSPPSFPTLASRLLSNYPLHPLFDAQYTICDELGSGGFGFVVRAIRNGDGKGVAVKFIERAKIPSHGWVNSRSWGEAPGLWDAVKGVRTLPMEAYVLRSVRHEGVVAYVDLFEDAKYFYLVMEHHGSPWQSPERAAKAVTGPSSLPALASFSSADPILIPRAAFPSTSSSLFSPLPSPPGLSPPPRPTSMQRRSSCDLFECIEQHSRLSEDTAKYVFAQIVEVVWALGKIGICHRDIKDENFVVSADFKVKLIDFGSAVIFDPRNPAPFYTRFYGTTSFASPEILRGDPYQAPASEVWSLGILLSILVTGECPFADASAAQAGRISRSKTRLGSEVEGLLRACLEGEVGRRITVGEMRRHSWLRGALRR